ncbi:MAG: phytanoyl-CoA dioxygenase family protein [Bacteroidota bacterium]
MPYFVSEQDIDLDMFASICEQIVDVSTYPTASEIDQNVPVYDASTLLASMDGPQQLASLKEELYHCLKDGPGVFVVRRFYEDLSIVDRSTNIFYSIIEEEKTIRIHAGDHFAKEGANERIWNSFQKVCEKDSEAFIDYYKNPLYRLLSEIWLGPGYQLTAQVNIVKAGGTAQSAHRDYHLGFQTNEMVAHFPKALQLASQYLTLQGSIAHTDMPPETGPTLLLPFSQQYDLGYLAWRDEGFRSYFQQQAIQPSLQKGDAVFFSPALFHAAGTNSSTGDRIGNLIQVSTAFGKAMESIDRLSMMKQCYPVLLKYPQPLSGQERAAIIRAIADGYPFPSNLDQLPPIGGMAPLTMQHFMERALEEGWPSEEFNKIMDRSWNLRQA